MKAIGVVALIVGTGVLSAPVVHAGPPPGTTAPAPAPDGAAVLGRVAESVAAIATDAGVHGGAVAVAHMPGRGTIFATDCRTFVGATRFTVAVKGTQAAAGQFLGGNHHYKTCVVFAEVYVPIPDTANPLAVADGDKVFTVAASNGSELTVAEGVLSAKRGETLFDPPLYLQTTASVAPGSRGVGLFDASGRLLAIAEATNERQNQSVGLSVHQHLRALPNPTIEDLDELNRALKPGAATHNDAK